MHLCCPSFNSQCKWAAGWRWALMNTCLKQSSSSPWSTNFWCWTPAAIVAMLLEFGHKYLHCVTLSWQARTFVKSWSFLRCARCATSQWSVIMMTLWRCLLAQETWHVPCWWLVSLAAPMMCFSMPTTMHWTQEGWNFCVMRCVPSNGEGSTGWVQSAAAGWFFVDTKASGVMGTAFWETQAENLWSMGTISWKWQRFYICYRTSLIWFLCWSSRSQVSCRTAGSWKQCWTTLVPGSAPLIWASLEVRAKSPCKSGVLAGVFPIYNVTDLWGWSQSPWWLEMATNSLAKKNG